MANRKVIITYKADQKGYVRPPFYTTEENIPNQDKFFRDIIKEIVLAEPDKTINIPIVKSIASTVSPIAPIIQNTMPVEDYLPPVPTTQTPPFTPTDEQLFSALMLKGKTQDEITEFLKPKEYIIKPFEILPIGIKDTKIPLKRKKVKEKI